MYVCVCMYAALSADQLLLTWHAADGYSGVYVCMYVCVYVRVRMLFSEN